MRSTVSLITCFTNTQCFCSSFIVFLSSPSLIINVYFFVVNRAIVYKRARMSVAMRSLMLYSKEFISFPLTASHSSSNGNIICFYQHTAPNNRIFISLVFSPLRGSSCGDAKRTLATWTVMVLCRLCVSLFCVLCNNVEQLCSWFIQFESGKEKGAAKSTASVCFVGYVEWRRMTLASATSIQLYKEKDSFASSLYEPATESAELAEKYEFLPASTDVVGEDG